ncbi:two-component system sensor histidine kinase NtrB [Alkaliphilus peptidifermentans]|uniref:two-component system sensor histidine kinase NtrB n=1 Tax=Alkaliphilus peptidifermentans TaxID=426129 RepID=UPI001FA70DC6|nr:ATP-binding protein [Alkaliphilus peptidifermentans]
MKTKYRSEALIIILILAITGFHYFTMSVYWPVHDFYRRLYYLPIILASFKFRLKGGFLASLAVVLLYAPHLIFYYGEINIEVINQFLEAGMFMVVGMITGYLVEKDHKKRILLENQLLRMANLENYTQNILDSLDSSVIAIDRKQQVSSMNNKAYDLFSDKNQLLKLLYKEKLIEELEGVISGVKVEFHKEIIYCNRQDKDLNLYISVYPLKNISNLIEGVVVVIQDITSFKELEQQVRRSERLSAIGQLASGIAHEIRNPLGIIKTISQTLKPELMDSDNKEAMDIISQEIDRANKVIKELLDFAKPYTYKLEVIQLPILLEELMVLTKKYGEQKGVNIRLQIKRTAEIKGDLDKLKQGFINIIFNAIQAMPTGGVLEIIASRDDEWAIVHFFDEGEGISDEIKEKIFNPFFTTKDTGTGLGLAITHRIIEEHHGKINIYSRKDHGTNVAVYLPTAKEVNQIG